MTLSLDSREEHLLREVAPQVLGAVMRRFGDFAACEDAVQEALVAAAATWPRQGVPANPRGWLFQVASRRMMDHLRSESARRRREAAALRDTEAAPAADEQTDIERDDTLTLLFMCCHDALTPASAIALTLRAVGGLTTSEIAHAFMVPETTMAQRISRAKQTIRASSVPFRPPAAEERDERLAAVLHVLYLIFNEGYTSTVGPNLQREDLSNQAIRLARTLHTRLPDVPEVGGLLALMLLTDARRRARTGPNGELIPLSEQDRTLWDHNAIADGVALLSATLANGSTGPYQLQAAIAALHDEAPCAEETDWPQILALYELLEDMTANPMVTLNRAIATAMVEGPPAGLALIDDLAREGRLDGSHRVDAVRAHLLEMAGDPAAALDQYRTAAGRATNLAERDYLLSRAARLGVDPSAG